MNSEQQTATATTKQIDWQAYEEWYANRNSVTLDKSKPVIFLGMATFYDGDYQHVKQGHVEAYIPVRFIIEPHNHELWIVSPGNKIVVGNMVKEDAYEIFSEFVRQYLNEGWAPVTETRVPSNLSKLTKDGELVLIGVIDTTAPPVIAGIPHWLVRVPEAVAHV